MIQYSNSTLLYIDWAFHVYVCPAFFSNGFCSFQSIKTKLGARAFMTQGYKDVQKSLQSLIFNFWQV